ncbi:hypothetical protein MKZ38_005763 [Zalerion maritima]|uniref:Phospholipid-transporting ATPase n=1 Tax=Zalerion maritima TaxID=339359 RepID=A0AAD5WQ54_9PEZI|nr:hypothetical protein MKZ38_005763 [Zalerion maritima]
MGTSGANDDAQPGRWAWPKLFLRRQIRRLPFTKNGSGKGGEKDGGGGGGERHIPLRLHRESPLVDPQRGLPYIANTIRTSRYTVWDFLPKQFFFQFSRLGNFYFLCVGVPQTVPGLSTTGNFTTILPLMFFVMLTMAKEGFFDYKRHRQDKVENANPTTVLRISRKQKDQSWQENTPPFEWADVKWEDVKVGDIVKLKRDDPVPADLILIHASGEDGLAYVETMALDGETNLKTKNTPSILEDCDTVEGIAKCRAEFVVEAPNRDLYRFEGKLAVEDAAVPLTINELLHRGTTLRNTEEALGIAVNTGEECKIRMNANHHPRAKKPAIEAMINWIIITLAVYMVTLSCGLSGGYIMWQDRIEDKSWSLDGAAVPFYEIIIGFLIQFNNVIPLALFISLEIVKLAQQLMLNSDIEIYDESSDTPTRCNTNTILENLGQISYILTDKTGTLTENVLKFRKMSVAGTSWYMPEKDEGKDVETDMSRASGTSGTTTPSLPSLKAAAEVRRKSTSSARGPKSPFLRRIESYESHRSSIAPAPEELSTEDLNDFVRQRPNSSFTRKAREFILAMALCHTCLPEERDGEIDYQASSADELALVRAAADMGFKVTRRSPQIIAVRAKDLEGEEKTTNYEILDIVEFSSKRKRFSIVIKYPDGRIALLCKGADSMILPRLRQADLAIRMAKEAENTANVETKRHQEMEERQPRNSFGGRPSLTISRSPSRRRRTSFEEKVARSRSLDLNRTVLRNSLLSPQPVTRSQSFDIRGRTLPPAPTPTTDARFTFLDSPGLHKDENVFRRCFQQMEDYARDGLRTLIYAQKFIPEAEYRAWKKIYEEANTSFTNRQEMIENAGEIIEQNLELVGATAIEDRLQEGVPATIDKLRRANIKIWMLTGDKRETAINIAHSASICKPGSSVLIFDSTSPVGLGMQITRAAAEITSRRNGHNVIVFDGATLSAIDASDDLRARLFALLLDADSVICCRASPAQKAQLVRSIRSQSPSTLTLSIGDGGNDVAMIQEASVGVGISGGGAKEGLQAARIADFSIPQFRFLQRLLLVHGRWNYSRTAKFVLATFWKEAFFYIPAAVYQPHTGYTGTSLYEMASLTVFNTLFTALCVIVMGIWEQDLEAETLLAVPELYVYGQRNEGLNLWKYLRWMIGAVSEGILVWFAVWLGYGAVFGPVIRDNGLFAFGDLALFETHHKTYIVLISFLVTVAGWWAWNLLLSAIYTEGVILYAVRNGFIHIFGPDMAWWLTLIGALGLLCVIELAYKAVKRSLVVEGLWKWPPWTGGWKRMGAWFARTFSVDGIKERRERRKRRSAGGMIGMVDLVVDDEGEIVEPDATTTKTTKAGPGRGKSAEEWDLELWQELEQFPEMRERIRRVLKEERGEDVDGEGDADEDLGLDLKDVITR